MKYKVLLTTSGLGHRLGDITKFTNKSLVRVGAKPSISYIIESYPEDVEIVVTLGHFGSHVRQFLDLAYPNRHITYVTVDKYQGPGSSLAYSILQAQDQVNCPFIFHACDTIVTGKIQEPNYDWIGGNCSRHGANYVSLETTGPYGGTYVLKFKDKGELAYDYSYIGLAGIHNYEAFFRNLRAAYDANPDNAQLSDVAALKGMLSEGTEFEVKEFLSWYDIGNVDGLKKARAEIRDKFDILDKLEESIFIFDKQFVIKFFHDAKLCANRVTRGKQLKGLAPDIIDYTENFYKYEFVTGELMASSATEAKLEALLDWSVENLWIPHSDANFAAKCFDFYFTKTKRRLDKFVVETGVHDVDCVINGVQVPSIKSMLESLDVDWICSGRPHQFHGDFILDNIIHDNGKFILLDWRQDFAGDLKTGDLYYDLAKLNHNLVFNHDIVNRNLFTIDVRPNEVKCDILRSHNLVKCQQVLKRFVSDYCLNEQKLDIITALIWINMAPLHHYPLNTFLFYFGKLHLYKALHEIS